MSEYRALASLITPYRSRIFWVVICHILTAIFTLVTIPAIIPFLEILFFQGGETMQSINPSDATWTESWLLKFRDLISELGKEQVLLYICGLIILLFLLKNVFRYLAMYFMTPVRNGVIADLRESLFESYAMAPYGAIKKSRSGDLSTRMINDIQEVDHSILNSLIALFKSPLIIIGSLIFMLAISFKLTLFVLLLLVVTVFIIGGISRHLKQQSMEAQDLLGGIASVSDEAIQGSRILKIFGSIQFIKQKFLEQNTTHRNLMNRVLRRRDLSSPLSEFLGIVVVVLLLGYGSSLVFNDHMQPAIFFAFLFAFYQVIEPAKQFSTAYYSVQKGMGSLQRIQQIKDRFAVPVSSQRSLPPFTNSVVFQDVHFTYDEEDAVLKGLSFQLTKGEKVAIVGQSGSGKSTLFDLLLKFYTPDTGSILLDGQDIQAYRTDELHQQIGLVSQDPFIFHDTIAANISLSKDRDMGRVREAAQVANAHDFIMAMDRQYETIVGDRGIRLSGGQKQRIALARVLYHDREIVLLDEATSALDAHSEQLIHESLNGVLQDKTALIIAHRLSTLKVADRIVVMKDGRIVEQGTHEILMKNEGEYTKLMVSQTL